jgi:hypothetical protein
MGSHALAAQRREHVVVVSMPTPRDGDGMPPVEFNRYNPRWLAAVPGLARAAASD